MTRQGAIDTGQNAAVRFGKPFTVWRMPFWPKDVYGVRAEMLGFPTEAETFERLLPHPIKLEAKQEDLF